MKKMGFDFELLMFTKRFQKSCEVHPDISVISLLLFLVMFPNPAHYIKGRQRRPKQYPPSTQIEMLPFRQAFRLNSTRCSLSSILAQPQIGMNSFRLQSTMKSAEQVYPTTVKGSQPMTVDRELPDPFKDRTKNRLQFIGFWVLMGACAVFIFNYEKTTSPIVTTTMHFLRKSQTIREVLGDKIDFTSMLPWISGELNQVKGKVNITFKVGGSKKTGIVRLVADRESKHHDFLIHEWTLTVDGETYDLFEDKTVDFGI